MQQRSPCTTPRIALMDEPRPPGAARASILPLVLHEVSYHVRGKQLLHEVSLRLEAGSRSVLMGPNGAGKSLLMRICHGLLQPSAGRVIWHAQRRHAQAMVFQRPVLLRRSAARNIEFALRAAGVAEPERAARVTQALEQAGLAELAQRQARVLSGGEQQKLALARAWALRPQVLFLDEPTANLDPAAVAAVESLIDNIHAAGTKVVMSTHDLGQARRLADEVLFINQGRLLQQSPAAEFFARPGSAAAEAFIEGRLYWE